MELRYQTGSKTVNMVTLLNNSWVLHLTMLTISLVSKPMVARITTPLTNQEKAAVLGEEEDMVEVIMEVAEDSGVSMVIDKVGARREQSL